MKFTINQRMLMKHISIAQKAVSSKSTMPILEGLYLIAENNYLQIISTDLKITIKTKVEINQIEEGRVVINSNLFSNLIRKLPDDNILINVVDEKMFIKCQQSDFTINCYDRMDYPSTSFEENKEMTFSMSSTVLKDVISQTVFSTSQELTKPYLTGVLFNIKNDAIDFVSLDGYRISIKSIKNSETYSKEIIIPGRSLVELNKILDEEINVDINILKGNVMFSFDNTKFYSRLIDGKFINYEPVLNQEFNTEFVVDKTLVERAIERASLLAKEDKANLVKITFENNLMEIKSNTEIGNAVEIIEGEQAGEDILIAFNAKYLIEGLRAIKENKIIIKLQGPENACTIEGYKETADYKYIVLPVRLSGE